MTEYSVPKPTFTQSLEGRFLRLAASGLIPARWYQPTLPQPQPKQAPLSLEIVSHCWNYAHLLVYQLSSLVNYPPKKLRVTMTVFYNSEDTRTQELLNYFTSLEVENVTWNWRELPKQALFRRAIGRNLAAKQTQADWVWFTDCDLLFQDDCLEALSAQLEGRTDRLVYPQMERCTSLLANDDPMLKPAAKPQVMQINTSQFEEYPRTRATGPLQITHGDVARACGYCDALSYYQQPSATWCKAYEDRAFRWLLRTQGTPLDIPGVFRIRHIHKGRYTGSATQSKIRTSLRRLSSWWKEKRRHQHNRS